jgi:branched-chain amino acid transport system ATP-binding protein
MAEPLLSLKDVRAGYGEAIVLDGISLDIGDGASLALLGRNGVGKSTLILTIMGFTRLASGTIAFAGRNVTAMAPHRRARLGLGWIPQERDVFASLTVEENLDVVARPGRWDAASVFGLFPRLAERRRNMGNHLSGGEQQMLTIARTLMTNPKLLLLDEPLEGLAPIVVEELAAAIRKMAAEGGMSLILVEQHAEIALALTSDAVLIERGRIAHGGPSAALLKDPETLERYIGLKLQS